MPKNKVVDPITDQEIAFARLVLSGAMTDRHAAEAVGLNPDSAAYTKSKPYVRAYMLEHHAAVQQQLVQQEADLSRQAVEELHRLNLDREQVLVRLACPVASWGEIAHLSPDMTRGSITGQVKAVLLDNVEQVISAAAVGDAGTACPSPFAHCWPGTWPNSR